MMLFAVVSLRKELYSHYIKTYFIVDLAIQGKINNTFTFTLELSSCSNSYLNCESTAIATHSLDQLQLDKKDTLLGINMAGNEDNSRSMVMIPFSKLVFSVLHHT